MFAIEKRLELNGVAANLVRETVTLELGAVGRGRFVVSGLEGSPGTVTARYLVGVRADTLTTGGVFPIMLGVVSESALTAPGEWSLTVREPSALLKLPASFALRHCTPRRVLAEIEALTGLSFVLPAKGDYLTRRLAHFAPGGNCRAALEAMGPAWEVSDAAWSGLPDGRIYWGSWAAGPWGTEPVELDPDLVVSREERALVLPLLPTIRPGVLVKDTIAGSGPVMINRAVFGGSGREGNVRIEWGEV